MATTLGSWAKAVRQALLAAGLDADVLLLQAGIEPQVLLDPNARCPTEATARLWQLAVAATGDPAFGLAVARCATPDTFHALGVSLLASDSLWQALNRLVRYFAVVTEVAELDLSRAEGRVVLAIRSPPGEPAPLPEAVDALASLVVRLSRALRDRSFAPRSVRLTRDAPGDRSAYERAFRCPLSFGMAVNELVFDDAAFDEPLPSANDKLARAYDKTALRYLAQLTREDTGSHVRRLLCRELALGEPDAASVARSLNLSLRTLQRELAAEGTSFKVLLDEVRRELALAYLAEGRDSIGEIAYLLGFSHAASFTHACARWTGKSPRALRVIVKSPSG